MDNVKNWMTSMRLKLNGEKIEFIMIGHKTQLSKCDTTSVEIDNNTISLTDMVKYLGAHLDQQLAFKKHITEKCRKAMTNLIGIRNMHVKLVNGL